MREKISKDTQSNTKCICCDLFDLPHHLNQQFDIVFSSYGTIGWLPNLNNWAKIVSQFLKLIGKSVFAELHPVVWMFDDNFEKVDYNYLNSGAIIETETGTYANKNSDITQLYVMWKCGISEVVNSLINHGLEIKSLDEYEYSPYNCFSRTIEFEPKKYLIEHFNDKIPLVYCIHAIRK